MLHVHRCPEGAGFEGRAQKAQQKVADKIREHGRAALRSKDFSAIWKNFKPAFVAAQHGKCGYCEFDIAGNAHGDLEHYAPKVAYPELAYRWDNYLYACDVCNQVHKGDRFPTAAAPPPGARPAVSLADGRFPLLLHPMDPDTDPADHLSFDEFGQISARDGSDRGWHTIDVCALDRESLRTKRAELAAATRARLAELEDCVARADQAGVKRVLAVIEDMGARHRRFAGMVRAMFCQAMDTRWRDCFED